jgi:16S rRNA G1207 methylase RsmC
VYKIIEEAFLHLNKNGFLQLVATHNKGGAMLEKKMKEVFGNVETLTKKSGFRVYCSRKE